MRGAIVRTGVGHSVREAHMRRTLAILVIAALVASAIGRLILVPTTTIAGTDDASVLQTAVPVYDLDVHHPGMKALPVEEAPLP